MRGGCSRPRGCIHSVGGSRGSMNINRCAERDRTIMKRLPVSRVDIGKGLCIEFRHLGGVDRLSVGHVLMDVWHPFDRCLAQFSTVW